jgi:arginyl-tRNA synthetase
MFEQEKSLLENQLLKFCQERSLPAEKLEWRSIPFSGEWGIAAPLFPLAAADPARQLPVPLHAQALAEALRDSIQLPAGFSRMEAVRGYLNLYYEKALTLAR